MSHCKHHGHYSDPESVGRCPWCALAEYERAEYEARAEKAEAEIEGHRAAASIFAVSERDWKDRALKAERDEAKGIESQRSRAEKAEAERDKLKAKLEVLQEQSNVAHEASRKRGARVAQLEEALLMLTKRNRKECMCTQPCNCTVCRDTKRAEAALSSTGSAEDVRKRLLFGDLFDVRKEPDGPRLVGDAMTDKEPRCCWCKSTEEIHYVEYFEDYKCKEGKACWERLKAQHVSSEQPLRDRIAALKSAIYAYDLKLLETWGIEENCHAVAYGWTKAERG